MEKKVKWANRFLKRNHWNLSKTKLETLSEGKVKNLLRMKEKAVKILKEKGE